MGLKGWFRQVMDAYLVPMQVYNVGNVSAREYFLKVVVPLFVPSFLVSTWYLFSSQLSGPVMYFLLIPISYSVAALTLLVYLAFLRVGLYLIGAPESKKAAGISIYTLPFFALTPLSLIRPSVGISNLLFAIPYQAYLIGRTMREHRILDLDRSTKLAKKLVRLSCISAAIVFLSLLLFY